MLRLGKLEVKVRTQWRPPVVAGRRWKAVGPAMAESQRLIRSAIAWSKLLDHAGPLRDKAAKRSVRVI